MQVLTSVRLRASAIAATSATVVALAGCGLMSTGPSAEGAAGAQGNTSTSDAARPGLSGPQVQPGARQGAGGPQGDIATRNAVFKVASFDALPGWQQDNLTEAWAAFKESCKALERKPNWKKLCADVRGITDPKAGRALIEREFALLTVQNTDRTREGDITGYYEPLLSGRSQKGGDFTVPIYGVPNDMYFLDWKTLPNVTRKTVASVRPNGRLLIPAQPGELGAVKVDLRRFTLDTLDRRLRVRLNGEQGLPYYNRADIQRMGQIDAPVLAWVDDPVALYAMQVQGAGRIKMPDGSVIRLQYADQNGQPFKPMQVAAQGNERVQTRGANQGEEPEHFDLTPADAAGVDAAPAGGVGDEPLTRGGRKAGAAPEVSDAVNALLPPAGAAKVAAPVAKAAPRQQIMITPQGAVAVPSSATAPAMVSMSASNKGSSQSVVDALLPPGKPGAQGAGKTAAKVNNAGNTAANATANTTANTAAASPAGTGKVSATLLAQRAKALETDPSYVFFRVAPEAPQNTGPMGALGVPLTAGRSLAVDPRVMPLGYPVFLDAAGTERQQTRMQRLMFAQDTGGAIRGAVRADYFWGYGADAGRLARQTRHRGRMWVMVPHAEVAQLMSSKLVVRGQAVTPECLVPDDEHCEAALDLDQAEAQVAP